MHDSTGEILTLTQKERDELKDANKWLPISEKEHAVLLPLQSGLRPETLKKMRLRMPAK